MAKSMSSIKVNYSQAMQASRDLKSIADDLQKVERSLGSTLGSLGSCWKSDNSTRYIRKGETLNNDICGIVRKINEAASSIANVAKNTYNADMRALELAKKRTY